MLKKQIEKNGAGVVRGGIIYVGGKGVIWGMRRGGDEAGNGDG